MKILHVLNHSLPHTDGYCVRSANIVRFQAAMGWQPVVVTSPYQEPEPSEPVELIEGIKYYRVMPHRQVRLPVFHQFHAVLRLRRRIGQVVREERPDVIHVHSPSLWAFAALPVAKRHGLPVVYEIRGLWEDGAVDQGRIRAGSMQYRVRRLLDERVAQRSAAVVVISGGLARDFQDRGVPAVKLFVVPNGVDAESFSRAPSDDRLRRALQLNGALVIGYIGSLYPWEGVKELVEAAGR
ncbi:MAG TPA: glycosyltransferase WbuB, partial [Planctomycetaceae bacterium]|nr:glycosyltransferase WbuB [Planctomycetaceae bacterium]